MKKTKKERIKLAAERRAELEARPHSYLWELHVSSCIDMKSKLEPESVDAIITDPPYPMEYLPCYDELGALAEHVLKPGGFMLIMTGHMIQYSVVNLLAQYKRLKYHWTLCYSMSGGTSSMPFRKIGRISWKPILMYVKDHYGGVGFSDVIVSPYQKFQDRSIHKEWQQSDAGFREIVNKFCFPSDVVLDPFAGSSTTGVAALNRGCTFIGSDIDPDLVRKSRLRLANLPVMFAAEGV